MQKSYKKAFAEYSVLTKQVASSDRKLKAARVAFKKAKDPAVKAKIREKGLQLVKENKDLKSRLKVTGSDMRAMKRRLDLYR